MGDSGGAVLGPRPRLRRTRPVHGKTVRRDIADLILEALDVAGSRKLAPAEAQAYALELLHVERPDIPHGHAARLLRCFLERRARCPAE